MKFCCTPCSYTTNRQIDLNRHKLSVTHIEKVQLVTEELSLYPIVSKPDTTMQFKCTYCGTAYSTSGNRSKHMKRCVKKVVDTIIKEKNDTLKEKDNNIKLILNEKDIQLKDIVINSMKKDIELLNIQLDKQTEMIRELLKENKLLRLKLT